MPIPRFIFNCNQLLTRQPEYFRGLVQPTDTEQTLNGYKFRQLRRLDWEQQFEKAIAPF